MATGPFSLCLRALFVYVFYACGPCVLRLRALSFIPMGPCPICWFCAVLTVSPHDILSLLSSIQLVICTPTNSLILTRHWHTKFCHNMLWIFSKFISYLAYKFCSICYNSNSIVIKTLCTPPWHQWHALFIKFFWNYFHFSSGNFFSKCTEFCLSAYLM